MPYYFRLFNTDLHVPTQFVSVSETRQKTTSEFDLCTTVHH